MGGCESEGRAEIHCLPSVGSREDVIVTCVRWYLRFRLRYRDLASIAAELGIAVAPSTILRWVVRYTEEGSIAKCGTESGSVETPCRSPQPIRSRDISSRACIVQPPDLYLVEILGRNSVKRSPQHLL